MIDPSAEAFTRMGIMLVGVTVRFERVAGFAPNATTISATVTAKVMKYALDTVTVAETGYPASKPGAIRQGDREVIVMAADLAAQGFPLPVLKSDRVVIDETGDTLSIIAVDAHKRAFAGCIEIDAAGVQ
jgi:hypothetical protein